MDQSQACATDQQITATQIDGRTKGSFASSLFGSFFPMLLEPFIFGFADRLSPDYSGGNWNFYALSNGGFFMAPVHDSQFRVLSENGYQGEMSPEALGITATLYAYGQIAARNQAANNEDGAEKYSEHYHLLYDYMVEHAEVGSIHAAID